MEYLEVELEIQRLNREIAMLQFQTDLSAHLTHRLNRWWASEVGRIARTEALLRAGDRALFLPIYNETVRQASITAQRRSERLKLSRIYTGLQNSIGSGMIK